jgi:hypothetical protein
VAVETLPAQVLVEAAVVHQLLVHQAWVGLEAAAVLAPPSPSQAPPPHSLGEVGVQELTPQALGEQGEEGLEVAWLGGRRPPFHLPLGRPTLAVVAGGALRLEHQGVLAS